MRQHSFHQVDVFTEVPYLGNPVAVVHDADDLSTEQMTRIANWTNLSETTFLLRPTDPAADYRVRIFTPSLELPFAGHPTLGSCHSWLEHGGHPRAPGRIVQECGMGLVSIRRTGTRLAFAAPPLIRSGPVDEATLDRVAAQLRIDRTQIVAAQWAANGPEWVAVLLGSAADVLAVRPGVVDLDIGLAGRCAVGDECAFEVRAFFPKDGSTAEDPVTGSLNASLAQWLLGAGLAQAPYRARQGTALGREGRIDVDVDPEDGTIWIGGGTVTCVSGTIAV